VKFLAKEYACMLFVFIKIILSILKKYFLSHQGEMKPNRSHFGGWAMPQLQKHSNSALLSWSHSQYDDSLPRAFPHRMDQESRERKERASPS
jgi:hypothetical protein